MTVSRLARAATIVALFGLVSRFLGLLRNVALAGYYGTSGEADAFVNGLLIVNVGAAVLLYLLVTVVIPLFQSERADHGEDSAWRLVWAIAGWVGVVTIAVGALIGIWPEAAAATFQLDPHRAELTTELIRIMAPALLFQGISALFTALLQIHGRFGIPAAVGMAFNAGTIGGIMIGHATIGIHGAAWGVTAGALMQVLLQLPQFFRVMGAHKAQVRLSHPRLGRASMLALPVAAASVIQQVNNWTDKFFASSLDAGRVAALDYANSLGSAPRTALLVPFLTPLFPLVARLMAQGRTAEAARGVQRVTGLLGLVAVPTGALLAVYAHETAQLTLGRGSCDASCVTETSKPLFWYAIALLLNFLTIFLNRVLAADNRQRDVLLATIASVVATIALDAALIGPMEQAGLALASAIGVGVNLVIYLAYLRRRLPEFSTAGLARQQARLVACGGATVAVALLLDRVWDTSAATGGALAWPLAAKVAAGVAAYLALAAVLARGELREARGAVAALVRRGPRPA